MIKSIKKDDNDSRLDRWLFKNELVNSVVEAQKFIRSGKVKVNDERVKINARIFTGDEVETPSVKVIKEKKKKYTPTEQDKQALIDSIIYKDENVLVINKPAGLAVQGGSGSFKNLDSMLEVLRFDKEEKPKLVHRLDKHTSGALVLARNNQSARKLLEYFKSKKVQKTYWAWGFGICNKEEGVIDAPLMKSVGGNEKVLISSSGKEARTRYKVIDKYKNIATLFELNPETGRMHQIRVHLTSIGHPIIGDGKYGGKKVYLADFEDKMYLHAVKVSFPDPENEAKTITVRAPAPPRFAK